LTGTTRHRIRARFSESGDAVPRSAVTVDGQVCAHNEPMNPPSEVVQRRVLVVEDNRDCAESLRQLLALCGYEVLVTHSAQQGLEGARRLQPHAVLCDIDLPDTDGYTVGSILRQSGRAPRARLIALTGYGEPRDRRRALAAGFDQHLVKPVETSVLLLELETETKA